MHNLELKNSEKFLSELPTLDLCKLLIYDANLKSVR